MKWNCLWIISVWAATMLSALATNVYVAAPGSVTPAIPYTNWTMAATNIQDAVDAIVTNGGNYVFVSNGTYYLTNQIVITKGITLQSWNQGVLDPTNTVIHGNNYDGKPVTNRCVYMNHPLARLVGFTLTQGGHRQRRHQLRRYLRGCYTHLQCLLCGGLYYHGKYGALRRRNLRLIYDGSHRKVHHFAKRLVQYIRRPIYLRRQ